MHGTRLRLAADKTRDLGERRPRVEHGEMLPQAADRAQCGEQFVTVEIDELRPFPVNQRGRAKRLAPRIGKGNVVEP
jgi:hypothetical protein